LCNDYFDGACLDLGIHIAQGEYVFRFDDDDFYGPNYLLDTMLAFRAVDAQMTGKEFKYLKVGDNPDIYGRLAKCRPPTVFTASYLSYGAVGLAGCTLGGTKEFFLKNIYPIDIVGAADKELSLTLKHRGGSTVCLCLDQFNMVVFRNEDVKKHTWLANNNDFIRGSEVVSDNITDLMV
jgi:hypothetical protein